jgi:hypothetical protein
VTTDGSGAAALALPIPFDPALSGLRLYAQAFVSDPNGAFGRALAFTPGLELAIGD